MFTLIPSGQFNLTGQNESGYYSFSGSCIDFQKNTILYIIPTISGIGIILNILNLLVFTQTPKQLVKGDMIKYLMGKSVFDLCFCLIVILQSVTAGLYDIRSFYYFIFDWCILRYCRNVVKFLSISFDFLAIISRYSLLTKRIQWVNKIIVFRKGMPIFTSIGFIIYSYKFAMYNIVPYTLGGFTLENGVLSIIAVQRIELIQSTIVNFIFPTIILIFNILIGLELKNTMKKKRRLSTNMSIHDKIKRSENRNTAMLILSSPITIFPNLAFFCAAILVLISPTQFYNACIDNIGNIAFYSQFSFSCLFYLLFNVKLNFRKNLKKLILNCIK